MASYDLKRLFVFLFKSAIYLVLAQKEIDEDDGCNKHCTETHLVKKLFTK